MAKSKPGYNQKIIIIISINSKKNTKTQYQKQPNNEAF